MAVVTSISFFALPKVFLGKFPVYIWRISIASGFPIPISSGAAGFLLFFTEGLRPPIDLNNGSVWKS